MTRYTQVLFSVAILILVTCQVVDARRVIPDNNLCYPALISIGSGTGTGCLYDIGMNSYLVTAKHVLFAPQTTALRHNNAVVTTYPPPPATGRYRFQIDLEKAQTNGAIRAHPSQDIVAVRIATPNPPNPKQIKFEPFLTILERYQGDIIFARRESAKSFEDVLIGNDIILFGYPVSLGLKNIPQLDYERPLLRKGIVAGKNTKQRTIVIDCPVYQGNSGGPVIEIEPMDNGGLRFELIGIVSDFVPYAEQWVNPAHNYANIQLSNSGYAIVVPIDSLDILLQQRNDGSAEPTAGGDGKPAPQQ